MGSQLGKRYSWLLRLWVTIAEFGRGRNYVQITYDNFLDAMEFSKQQNTSIYNGPYSLLVRASYFISCSVYARSTSVIFIVCKWRWGCRYFLISRISMPCSEAIGLIIR